VSIDWERFGGATDRLAVRIGLMSDPDGGVGATADESASWGVVDIWVKGRSVLAYREQGVALQGIRWYLLAFLEWLAQAWDPLLHEERLPTRNVADDAATALRLTQFSGPAVPEDEAQLREAAWDGWARRHNAAFARDGGLFPDLIFRRWRGEVELSWDGRSVPNVLFDVPVGVERFPPDEVATDLYDVVLATALRIQARVPESVRVGQLVEQLRSVHSSSRTPQRNGYLAGLRDGNEQDGAWSRLIDALRIDQVGRDAMLDQLVTDLVVIRPPALALTLAGLGPRSSQADIDAAVHFLARAALNRESVTAVQLARSEPVRSDLPDYVQGYALAEEVTASLGLHSDRPTSVSRILELLGVATADVELRDPRVRAMSVAGRGFGPTIATNLRYRNAQKSTVHRFTLAHELCHVLFDRGTGDLSAVASGDWAPRDLERRANAFAAMLLMPSAFVGRLVAESPYDVGTLDGIAWIAHRLETSYVATIHHLTNLGVIATTDRDSLLGELEPADTN
jgi:Zn-dependent peptidase ImmA (M78 family)